MAKRFDLIVFDWDGTLMDSAAAIVRAIQSASTDLGLPVPDDARARHVIGLGLVDALRHAVPDLAEHDYPRMVERYRHHYLSGDHELTLFDQNGVDTPGDFTGNINFGGFDSAVAAAPAGSPGGRSSHHAAAASTTSKPTKYPAQRFFILSIRDSLDSLC